MSLRKFSNVGAMDSDAANPDFRTPFPNPINFAPIPLTSWFCWIFAGIVLNLFKAKNFQLKAFRKNE